MLIIMLRKEWGVCIFNHQPHDDSSAYRTLGSISNPVEEGRQQQCPDRLQNNNNDKNNIIMRKMLTML